MRKGLTIIEVIVVVGVFLLILAIVVPVLSIKKKRGGASIESINLASLARALVVYGDNNKSHFPGLTATGDYMAKPFQGRRYKALPNAGNEAEEKSGEGCTVATGSNLALALLLDEDAIAPKQLMSTGETGETSSGVMDIQEVRRKEAAEEVVDPAGVGVIPDGEVRGNHFSYAMLAYGRPGLKREWRATMNQQACLLAIRLIFGSKPGGFSSVWTDSGSGQWEGDVAHGDGSVNHERFKAGDLAVDSPFRSLKYGATFFDAKAETTSVVGIFGRSNDMENFDATPETGVLGSAND